MKLKLVQLLTVCTVTLVVLSPEIVVFSMVWERHMELLAQTKNSTCEVNQNSTSKVGLALQEGTNSYQDSSHVEFSVTNFVKQSLNHKTQDKIVKILQWFLLLFPIILGLLVFFYDRYLVYRAGVFQQQVEMLERLWQQGIEQ
ncbi:hypothetical protein [Brasilonema bromeliae]|uniref:Uncharacterized protein n=1 Tax=Brasilonema bromeliae SPC951 TaxID=385972 RepID=A0ABX1PEE1_9CYAN|nr:hypothetical protein [Brasilonema bromeliae]NMG22328.1 hypothetical protein [Brasilonema bromeliae SPC951]